MFALMRTVLSDLRDCFKLIWAGLLCAAVENELYRRIRERQ